MNVSTITNTERKQICIDYQGNGKSLVKKMWVYGDILYCEPIWLLMDARKPHKFVSSNANLALENENKRQFGF